ncbi:hypothetical protein mRhiFer1_010134 [Rhinolophus ferrumequinum]|uniref:Uncharacterized protein n=1 Tax=Rhinolophus ferrumequinum TaxID=59479 RepID=A0A7J7XPY7_RHIFE|nr:hypothetical protein mRhiFer1_010134 [Rhinolophus ferrumequinum]
MPTGPVGCARLFLVKQLWAAGTHSWGGGGGTTAGSEKAGEIGGGAGSAARFRLGSVRARRRASGRLYWGGRIGGTGAMETPCQSLAGSANQDCDQDVWDISAPPRSRQRPPFTRGLFLSILQNLEEEKTCQRLGEKERREQQPAKAAEWDANLKQKERDRGSVEEVSLDSILTTFKSLLKSFKVRARTLLHLITQVLTVKSNTRKKRGITPQNVYTF